MTVAETIKHRKGLLLAAGFLVTGGWAAIAGPQGLRDLLEKRREIRDLQEHNTALLVENQQRRERIRKLSGSTEEQEIVVRDKLKLAKPNETIFILAPESAPTTGTPETPAVDPKTDR